MNGNATTISNKENQQKAGQKAALNTTTALQKLYNSKVAC